MILKLSDARWLLWTGPLALIPLFGCTPKSPKTPLDPQQVLVLEGHSAYVTHCGSCHGMDPKKDGPIGPSLWGSSLELLEVKTLRGEYPTGYKPKRETKAMAVLPFAKDKLPAIHSYLNSIP